MGTVLEERAEATRAPRPYLFTVDQYYRLVDAGVLDEDSRVELIDGELIDMAPIGSRHAYTVDRLNRIFARQAGDERLVRVQNPIHLGQYAEPVPDLALVRNRSYAKAHPGPEDVLLLIEVAETSLQYDRDIKIPLYARHGIPEVWLFDLDGRQLVIHLDPSEDGYRKILRPRRDERVSPVLLSETVVDLKDLSGDLD